MTAVAEFKAPGSPVSKRYDSVSYNVSSLNDQITELVAANEGLEGDIEVLEAQIRAAKKQITRNAKEADKLRRKRDAVSFAAYQASLADQP